MLRKTHVSIGIATALAVIHPGTVASCVFAIIGGAVGGWLPDIDLNTKKKINKPDDDDYTRDGVYYDPEIYGEVGNDHPGFFHDNELTQSAIQLVIIIGLALLADSYFKHGIIEYFANNFGIRTIIGLIAFVGLIILGVHTSHRTFTHSIVGCTLFSVAIWLMAEPLGIAFVCGFLAHIIIDILNKKPGNQYFWPIKPRIYLNMVPSNGKCNNVLGNAGVILSIFMIFYFLIPCLIGNPRMTELLAFLRSPVLTIGNISFSGLVVYLITINVVSFLAFTIEHLIYYNSFTWQYSDNDSAAVLTTLWIFAFAGGGIGMLLSVIISTKGHISKSEESNNTTLYLVPIVTIAIWAILVFIISNPSNIDFESYIRSSVLGNITIQHTFMIYAIIINLATFLLIMLRSNKDLKFTVVEVLTMILSLLGGAAGGYLAMGITNRKMGVHHFSFGLPLMMIIHAVVFSLLAYFSKVA